MVCVCSIGSNWIKLLLHPFLYCPLFCHVFSWSKALEHFMVTGVSLATGVTQWDTSSFHVRHRLMVFNSHCQLQQWLYDNVLHCLALHSMSHMLCDLWEKSHGFVIWCGHCQMPHSGLCLKAFKSPHSCRHATFPFLSTLVHPQVKSGIQHLLHWPIS